MPLSEEEKNNQINEFYSAFGEYAIEYEHLIHTIRAGIYFLLQDSGLKNLKHQNAITADLGASDLLSLANSILKDSKEFNDTENKIIKTIINLVKDEIEKRNSLIHRLWPVGWGSGDEDDFKQVSGTKMKNKRMGVVVDTKTYSKEDFKSSTKNINRIRNLVHRLYMAAATGYSIEKSFTNDQGKIVF